MKNIYAAIALLPSFAVAAAPVAPQQFKAEQTVVFTNSSPVCTTKEGLGRYITHLVKGETTKASAMEINPKTGDGECFMISKGKKVKILSVSYDSQDLPEIGVMEIVGSGNKSAVGAWALTAGAAPAK